MQKRKDPEGMILSGLKSEYTATDENANCFERRESPKSLILSSAVDRRFLSAHGEGKWTNA